MANPFGIPDEMFVSIVKTVMEQQTQAKKNPTDLTDAAKKSAETAKQLYDAYLAVGFNEKQAFELVKGILTTRKN